MSSGNRSSRASLPLLLSCGVLFIAGLAVWSFHLTGEEADRAWRALLINFLFFTPLTAGLVTWSAVVLASSGAWAGEAERIPLTGIGFALPSLLVLAALWLGSSHWSPWYGKEFHQGFWLNNAFVFARDGGVLLLFWAAVWRYRSYRYKGEGKLLAGWLILFYGVAFSLIGFDLGMGLDPHWSSSLFGGYFFVTGMYAAVAAWALLAVFRHGGDTEKLHDLGKLVFAFAILSAYMMYAQLLPIYYENIPRETRFVAPRLTGPWKGISIGLLATVYIGPVVLLLTARAKRSRFWLGAVCLIVLTGLWVERWWIVAPQFHPGPVLGWIEVSSTIAFLALLAIALELAGRRSPAAPAQGEGEEA